MKTVVVMMSLIILLVSTSGCATIVHGRSQDVALTETTFHRRFAQAVEIVKAGKPLPATPPEEAAK